MKVFRYFARFIVRPARAAEDIAADPRGLRAALVWLFLYGLAYALVALIFYLLGHRPVARPFLPIPLDRWYLYQSFYTVPVTFMATLTYTGFAYLVCRAFRGRGAYDATLASQAYTTVVPWIFFTLAPELLLAPFLIASGRGELPWPEWAENVRQFVLPIAWVLYGSTRALARIHGLAWRKALLAVLAGLIPMAAIFAVFIR